MSNDMQRMATFIKAGTEVQFAKYRLSDIIHLAQRTQPASDGDWEGYARDILRLIVNQAEQADRALNLIGDITSEDRA